MTTIVARLEELSLDPAAELAALTLNAEADGAIVSFVGMARPVGRTGARLKALMLEHHPRLTARSLDAIAAAAAARFDVIHVRVVHRCGEVRPGEPIVFAGASAVHRRAAFEAADFLMDKLKTEAVFWKREDAEDGSTWIEPTETDHADAARWSA
jgi:molybdopterin synthase catalytic subunit